jgi:signal transduction histidine kinase
MSRLVSRDAESSERSVSAAREIVPDPDRLAALAEFAAGAGHEINNPLATIVGRVQQLLRDETDPVRQAALHSIGAQAYRIRDMIGDVMLFARPPKPEPQVLSVSDVARDVLAKFSTEPSAPAIRVATDFAAQTDVFADPAQFAVILHELLRNARQALRPDGGDIRLNARRLTLGDLPFCEITIQDSGRGFSELEARHAFDPFFSGRQAGRGLGFGLCKCFRIAEMHRAEIEIASQSEGPTTVRLMWPASEAAAQPPSG